MINLKSIVKLAAVALFSLGATFTALAENQYPAEVAGDNMRIQLKTGDVVIQLLDNVAPNHAERIKTLTNQGFFDGLLFHRVIGGFMAQTGDPTGTGFGESELPNLKAETTKQYTFSRGVVGMARSNNLHSANSQFFIMLDDGPFLDRKYSIIGRVTSGMEYVDQIKKGDPRSGAVENPDQMIKVTIE